VIRFRIQVGRSDFSLLGTIALSYYVHSHSNHVKLVLIQLGFEIWKRSIEIPESALRLSLSLLDEYLVLQGFRFCRSRER